MKVLSVVGARPQFVKLAPVAHAFAARPDIQHVIVHTGQHYDSALSDIFFEELKIPQPDTHLGIGSASHAGQTAAMITALEPILVSAEPDWVLVYGDTNSTLAAAVVAVKVDLPVAHLEAGLRSFNRRMPEEHNRVLTDHGSDLLLAPTQGAMEQLAREGLLGRSVLVGDVMTDVCYRTRDRVAEAGLPTHVAEHANRDSYFVCTIHRPSNTDDRSRLLAILTALSVLDRPTLLIAHPRLVNRAESFGLTLRQGSLVPINPLGYPDLVRTVLGSCGVITDSGGLQKEAFLLGVVCTTIRTETEWVETLEGGWNMLDPNAQNLQKLTCRTRPTSKRGTPYGDGDAAIRVTDALLQRSRGE